MAKKLELIINEQTNKEPDKPVIVELMELLARVDTNSEEVELNKTSMKDALGRRILF
jgi:hypothetical protein